MKISIVLMVFVATMVAASAQVITASCVNIPYGLARGMENSHVLALQNFLFAKGLLKATPNGYFGPGTFAAVKALQKSAGLSQVGIAGPATRAFIKASTCTESATVSAPSNQPLQGNSTVQTPLTPPGSTVIVPRPEIESIDLATLFAGGETSWGLNLYGKNFATTSNTVYFKNMGNGTIYTIGTFESSDMVTITLPDSLGKRSFPCGNNCFQALTPGSYEISVQTQGGQSFGKYVEIKSFIISSTTGTETRAIPHHATSAQLGTVAFSASVPLVVRAVSLSIGTSTISSDGIGQTSYNDVIRREVLASDTLLPAFQTMIVEAMVSTANTNPGSINGYFTVEVEDYIGKKTTKFTSPGFLATVEGSL